MLTGLFTLGSSFVRIFPDMFGTRSGKKLTLNRDFGLSYLARRTLRLDNRLIAVIGGKPTSRSPLHCNYLPNL